MSLIEQFVESIECKKENDKIIAMTIGELGVTIEDSHTLPKWKIKQIYDVLFKSVVCRGRINLIQDQLAKELLAQQSFTNVGVEK